MLPRDDPVPRDRLILFSPLPPLRNGIADYSAELLVWHARDFAVTAVIDNAAPDPVVPDGVTVLRLAEYEAREAEFAAAPHLYHLGNNPDHVYLMPVLMRRPGVVVLHDVGLHHLLDCQTLRWGDVDGYCAALEREYGRPGRLLGEQYRRKGWRERMMFQRLPMNRSVIARARATIVHSDHARIKALAQDPAATVVSIPHHLSPAALAPAPSQAEARRLLGLDPDAILFMSLGFVNAAKQVDAVLRAMSRLRDTLPPFGYVIAGETLPEQYDVVADIARYGLGDRVTLTGYVPDEFFFTYVAAADVIINLRYPTGGETSGTLIRALGLGACVVVVDHGPFAELPDSVAVKVPWSPDFERALERVLTRLAVDAELRAEFSRSARRHIRLMHDIERSAAAYRDVVRAATGMPDRPWAVAALWEFPTLAGHEATLARARPAEAGPGSLWWRQPAVPLGQGAGDPATVLACFARAEDAGRLAAIYGHAGARRIAPRSWPADLAQLAERAAALLVMAAPVEEVGTLWPGLVAANRALAFGGLLILDLWEGGGATAGFLADPDAVDELLERAGFRLRERWSGPSDVSFAMGAIDREAWRHEPAAEVCWQAVKVSEFIDAAPERLDRARAGAAAPSAA